jgi:hypothetical protein
VEPDCEGLEFLGEVDHQLDCHLSRRGQGNQVLLLIIRQIFQLAVVVHPAYISSLKCQCCVEFLL